MGLVADGVTEIDTLLGGWEHATAGFLVDGPAPVLVETGSQSSVPVLLDALANLGIGPDDLAGIAVTHVHLDHAGGVGDVARAFPRAVVYVHGLGARHLVDPSRLVASAGRVYGPLLDQLYGRLEPTEADRIVVLGDGATIELGGGRTLTAVDSPGHAKHHLGYHDSTSGVLFAGDAAGVKLPDGGPLRPATPPPDFDLDLACGSLARFAARRPAAIALAHYGIVPGTPDEILADADSALRAWADEAVRAQREGRDIATALAERFGADTATTDPAVRSKLETLNGFHSNAAGFRRWLETRAGLAAGPSGVPAHHEHGSDHERGERVTAEQEEAGPG
jgi:glyoxylase-like metal-dependent hydrolase (beta-lactamase superfamily II)